MKENRNRRGIRSFLAGLLAVVLAVAPALSALPAEEVKAASEPVVWKDVVAGSNTVNGHNYDNTDSSVGSPAVTLHQTAKMPQNGSLSCKLRFVNDDPAQNANFALFYTFQDKDNWFYIGYDKSSKWYYQYMNNGGQHYGTLSWSPSMPSPEKGKEFEFSISLSREALQVTIKEGENEYIHKNTYPELLTLAEKLNGQGQVGFKSSKPTEFLFRDFTINNEKLSDDWKVKANNATLSDKTIQTYTVSGRVVNKSGKPVSNATVRVSRFGVNTDEAGKFSFENCLEDGEYTVSASGLGYDAFEQDITVAGKDIQMSDLVLPTKTVMTYDTYISSGEIRAAIDKEFPRVIQYEMLRGPVKGKIFQGQKNELDTIEINNTAIKPVLTDFEKTGDQALYKLKLVDEGAKIDMDMDVAVSVSENDLTWEITNIKKNGGCVKINTINVPQLNLITIDDGQKNPTFKGAVSSNSTTSSGDREIVFDLEAQTFVPNGTSGYCYAFLSADGLSAGLWSNSEAAGDLRVVRNNGSNTISLTSAPWYYDYGYATDENPANYDGTPVSELPSTKVCFAGDLNEDGVSNWQDGAIAYRDIMNNPYGSEDMPELVNYRIAMDFSSQATNPFLKVADNIKKVYLATDGLGQAVMVKGYGSEGHDSANSEYGNIGDRIGGVEDFKKLNAIAHQYNTEIGVHVNAQEAYPEAQTFSDDLIVSSKGTGWGWLDQSHVINKTYDLGTGLRYRRFLQLYDQLCGTSLNPNKWPNVATKDDKIADAETIKKTVEENLKNPNRMDFIYLDVWYQDAWETRKIAQEINSLGWRFSTEFGTTGEYDSTWQHWAAEAAYGQGKGYNSEVMRFIRNHQRDSFVPNYPNLGGEADNPLLGHLSIQGFEGWQGKNNYDAYITQTFTENLPAKFLQHYLITKWVDYSGVGEDVSPVGSQAKQITLKSVSGNDTVVVTRKREQREDNYVERTITLNGTKILDDVTYLLPWYDEDRKEEKLYHWNYDGGKTEWQLLDDWKGLKNVVVYELSDQGRGAGKTVDVTNGKIELDAKARTAYVVTKGEEDPKALNADFGEFAYVTDPGFNTYAGTGEGNALDSNVWSGNVSNSSIRVKKMSTGNQSLVIDSPTEDVSISTKLNSLTKGQQYIAEIYVDNRSDKKATIEVSDAAETVSAYTLASLEENWIQADAHNRNAVSGSRMQIMQVSFKATSEMATLTLKREAGTGITYFDDIRIIPKAVYNYRGDGVFVQDFESVAQGLYPFVLGSAQNVTDPVTHLSELHAPYTQSGWHTKILDDVISGRWSLKHHGKNTGIIYRTIPQNFCFEAGKEYEISFDYQSGSANSYFIAYGDEKSSLYNQDKPLEKSAASETGQKSTTKHYSFTLTGASSGQSWFGLYANGNQEQGAMGQMDFIMDNLIIKETGKTYEQNTDKNALNTLIAEASEVDTSKYTAESVKVFNESLQVAKLAAEKENASEFEIGDANYILTEAKKDLVMITYDRELRNKLQESQSLNPKDYTEESWQAVKKAMDDVEKALKSGDVSEETLNALGAALNSAQSALKAAPTVADEVDKQLTEAEKIPQGSYSDESYGNLQKVIDKVKEAREKGVADWKLREYMNELDAVIKALSEPVIDTPDKPGTSNPPTPPVDSLKKGDSVEFKNVLYKVIDPVKKTATAASVTKGGKNKKKLTIAATVKIKDVALKVVQIDNNAFKGCAKLKKVTIGANVKTIGKKSFFNCKKLTNVTFKGTGVKSVKGGAFKNTGRKMTVKVPKKLKKKARKSLQKKLAKAGMKKIKMK